MASFKPSDWSKAVQGTVGGITTIGIIIGLYISVSAWAEEKVESRVTVSELRTINSLAEQRARNDIDHDKMVQSTRITQSELSITVTEMKLEQLEEDIDERTDEGREPTARQERSLGRLTKLLETYETEQVDATSKLTKITTTTTTTTSEPSE